MTTIAAAEATDQVLASAEHGDIITPISDLTAVNGLLGGEGVARWKELFGPLDLPGYDGPIGYVVLDPGVSCGAHQHDAQICSCGAHLYVGKEEVYCILAGGAEMRVNGQELLAAAGDVITCPAGTQHWIGTPETADEPVAFLVVEMRPRAARPPRKPQHIRMGERVTDALGWWDYAADYLPVATVDLSRELTGPWGTLALAEIPPETVIGPRRAAPGTAQLVLPVSGEAVITVGHEHVKYGPGLPVTIGAVSAVTVENTSSSQPLKLITLSVRP
jgi:mannose-6-phosphate isomerase-like protein (cupin superfamily)